MLYKKYPKLEFNTGRFIHLWDFLNNPKTPKKWWVGFYFVFFFLKNPWFFPTLKLEPCKRVRNQPGGLNPTGDDDLLSHALRPNLPAVMASTKARKSKQRTIFLRSQCNEMRF